MQVNLTCFMKSAIIMSMNISYRVREHQKAYCRERMKFHKENVILQGILSFLFVFGALHAGQKQSILVPLILAPSAAASLSKLAQHESQRRSYKKQLAALEKTNN